jgi:hypothetical protein
LISNDLGEAIAVFGAALRRDGANDAAVASYERASRLFADWLRENGHATAMDRLAAWHVEDWEAHLRATMPHETFHDNHRGVQQFLTWYGRQRDTDWRMRSAWRRAPVDPSGSSPGRG